MRMGQRKGSVVGNLEREALRLAFEQHYPAVLRLCGLLPIDLKGDPWG